MRTSGTKGRKRVTLELQTESASEVFVAGTFNNWDPVAKQLKPVGDDSLYRATLMLPRGRHEYKFIIDGVWGADPGNAERVTNDHGSMNSVLVVT